MKNEPTGPPVRVKVQSVEIHNLAPSEFANTSIGGHIDRMMSDAAYSGRIPTKLVIEINPPQDRPESCE